MILAWASPFKISYFGNILKRGLKKINYKSFLHIHIQASISSWATYRDWPKLPALINWLKRYMQFWPISFLLVINLYNYNCNKKIISTWSIYYFIASLKMYSVELHGKE